jgi:hypothetical protein
LIALKNTRLAKSSYFYHLEVDINYGKFDDIVDFYVAILVSHMMLLTSNPCIILFGINFGKLDVVLNL